MTSTSTNTIPLLTVSFVVTQIEKNENGEKKNLPIFWKKRSSFVQINQFNIIYI